MMLDLESVRLFVLAAEFGNLTRAAEAAGTVQPVVSQRLKALEAALGRKLLERSPRFVRPTEDGAGFLARVRELLALHDAALQFSDTSPVRFAFGASDHALGIGLETVLRKVKAVLPCNAVIDVKLGLSHDMRTLFDERVLDAAIIRREGSGGDGEVLGKDPLGWRAPEGWTLPADGPVPLAILAPPCGVRAAAIRLLDQAKIPWREAFVASSCAAVLAAARAGIGVAPMGRAASGAAPDVGASLSLPALPASEIVLYAHTNSAAINALAAAVRATLT
jgi:DNA-binding transcriptional LysR family regulator